MMTVPFLTDIDPQAAVKGSRDPLGLQTIWARLGRHVVGNLTTVSTSVRDFATLVLGYYFAERVANEAAGDGDLAVFLRWEQVAAYARGGINGDWEFRGVERAKKNWNTEERIPLGTDFGSQILSNQKTYGLWEDWGRSCIMVLSPHGPYLSCWCGRMGSVLQDGKMEKGRVREWSHPRASCSSGIYSAATEDEALEAGARGAGVSWRGRRWGSGVREG